uniref:Uncharacterized protein n=1 Tax=Anguilla anguilla TaxID=7936 RepID=A0A0E9QZ59_ANGAN
MIKYCKYLTRQAFVNHTKYTDQVLVMCLVRSNGHQRLLKYLNNLNATVFISFL